MLGFLGPFIAYSPAQIGGPTHALAAVLGRSMTDGTRPPQRAFGPLISRYFFAFHSPLFTQNLWVSVNRTAFFNPPIRSRRPRDLFVGSKAIAAW